MQSRVRLGAGYPQNHGNQVGDNQPKERDRAHGDDNNGGDERNDSHSQAHDGPVVQAKVGGEVGANTSDGEPVSGEVTRECHCCDQP